MKENELSTKDLSKEKTQAYYAGYYFGKLSKIAAFIAVIIIVLSFILDYSA